MKAQLLLADQAQIDPTGKVHALGIGWRSTTGPTTSPTALVAFVEFDRDTTEGTYECILSLIDTETEKPVVVEGENGSTELVLSVDLEARYRKNVPKTLPLTGAIVINFGPGMNLEPGREYVWRITVDGKSDDNWSARMATVEASTNEDWANPEWGTKG